MLYIYVCCVCMRSEIRVVWKRVRIFGFYPLIDFQLTFCATSAKQQADEKATSIPETYVHTHTCKLYVWICVYPRIKPFGRQNWRNRTNAGHKTKGTTKICRSKIFRKSGIKNSVNNKISLIFTSQSVYLCRLVWMAFYYYTQCVHYICTLYIVQSTQKDGSRAGCMFLLRFPIVNYFLTKYFPVLDGTKNIWCQASTNSIKKKANEKCVLQTYSFLGKFNLLFSKAPWKESSNKSCTLHTA